jgi:ribosomal protein S18 acetylase RimI-like enzyme
MTVRRMSQMTTRTAVESLEKYRAEVLLKDGSSMCLRPIMREDEEKLASLCSRMSRYSLFLRFHHMVNEVPRDEVRRSCDVDYYDTFGLAATLGDGADERMVGVAHFYRLPSKDGAELALAVEDAYQGVGVGSHLLDHLICIAREKRIRRFQAVVMSENQRVLSLLQKGGCRVNQDLEYGVCNVVLPIPPLPKSASRTRSACKSIL